MRPFLIAAVAACVFGLVAACSSTAANNNGTAQQATTGILIDQACGAKMMAKDDPETAAAAHTKACATADACAASGYAVISGKEMLKFDDTGNQLAKDFLAKTDKTDDLRVTVQGTRNGDQIAVTSLTAASDSK
jgi:hypothetical protein